MTANRMNGLRVAKTKTGKHFVMEYPTSQYKEFFESAKEGCYDIDLKLSEKYALKIELNAYHSNSRFDLDNCIKPTLDALQKILKFNDCYVIEIKAFKHKVDKSEEKTEVVIESINYGQ